jgi:transposase-like protein
MIIILPKITTLLQYINQQPNLFNDNSIKCVNCGCLTIWKHGCYDRKSDRYNYGEQVLNPIKIQRFFCLSCKKTFSILPECIPPKRWYLWEIQQNLLALFLIGKSIYDIAKNFIPSRHTISRWVARFKNQFDLHKSILCQHLIYLGRTMNFADFWLNCFKNISLAQAMRICNNSGVSIP